jgi:hypothetical protein
MRTDAALSVDQADIIQWVAGLGAVTAEALAVRQATSVASARSRLLGAERRGLVSRRRPLSEAPAVYAITAAGLRLSGTRGLDPCRISPANAAHAIACASVAAALERRYRVHRMLGERELRRDERESGTQLASACLGRGPGGAPLLHRPDLVLWAKRPDGGLPVAVEVELTIKAPRRLLEICLAWARCRCVAGVLYIAAGAVERPLERAIASAQAAERIILLPLDLLACAEEAFAAPSASTVPGAA